MTPFSYSGARTSALPLEADEIIFETPGRASVELQAEAAQVGLQTILAEYRGFIAYAQHL